MEKTLSSIFSMAIYVFAASFLSIVIMASVLAIKWGMNPKKITQLVAVAQGLDLIDVGIDAERLRENPPEQQVTLEEILEKRSSDVMHLQIREQAIRDAMGQMQFEMRKLADERRRFLKMKIAFEEQITEQQEGGAMQGMEAVASLLITIKSTQAKDILLQYLEEDRRDEVVALLGMMPTSKAARIIGEFKTATEMKQLTKIIQEIGEGQPVATLIRDALAQMK